MQQRKLVLVLDLDETLVHSIRSSVRHLHPIAPGSANEAQPEQAAHEAEENEKAVAVATITAEAAALTAERGSGGCSAPVSEDEDEGFGEAPAAAGASPPPLPRLGGSAGAPSCAQAAAPRAEGSGEPASSSVTLTVQNVQFEMELRPGEPHGRRHLEPRRPPALALASHSRPPACRTQSTRGRSRGAGGMSRNALSNHHPASAQSWPPHPPQVCTRSSKK